ncbi:MAG TPA: HlyD family secretion protein [Allosphingosinicella sp.]|jgi:membrane fusion protein (multidrug efflux system)
MAELALVARTDEPVARKHKPEADASAAPPADASAAQPKRKRGRLLGGIGGLALIGAVALGYQYQAVWSHQETTDNAYVRADITPVAAKVEGYVARLMVDDNQRVKAGDVLMVIEPADFQAKVARAEADVASAEANVQTLVAARRSAGAELGAQAGVIGQATANVAAAEATARRAAADEARFSELASRGWTTRARLDQARAEAQAARAAVLAARASVSAQRGGAGALAAGTARADAAIAAGEAQLRAARAALAAARLDLTRTVVRAPVDGVVGNRAVRPGQLVKAGQQLLAVVPMQQSYVVANFKETQLEKMKIGQKVELHLDAYPSLALEGRVESLAPASGAQFSLIPTDSATGNFTKIVQRVPVKIAVEKNGLAAQLLRPGLSVEATVNTAS